MDLRKAFRRFMRNAVHKAAGRRIVQKATGDTVVQVRGDARTVIAGDVNIYPADGVAQSKSVPDPSESPGDHAYRQRAMWVSATGGDGPAVRVVARYPGGAVRFVAGDVVAAVSAAAHEYLNVYTAGLPLAGRSSEHVDFETPRTADGRHITIQALNSGVLDVCISRPWATSPGVPWDWLTGELYTLYYFLNDVRARGIYGATEPIRVYSKLANLRGSRVSVQGVKTTLRGAYGRLTNLVVVPLSWHEWQLEATQDPWPAVREFLHLALADSGAYGFENDVDRMDGAYFEILYFEPIAPSVRFWRPGQAAPQAIQV